MLSPANYEDMTVEELEAEIVKHEKKILELRDAQATVSNFTDAQKLAIILHRSQCHYNHCDGCSWFYEKWADPGHARSRWLEKAEKLLETGKPFDEIVEIAKLMH